jgi:hypothetical protein
MNELVRLGKSMLLRRLFSELAVGCRSGGYGTLQCRLLKASCVQRSSFERGAYARIGVRS